MASNMRWQKLNSARFREVARKWTEANRDKVNEKCKRFYWKNLEARREKTRLWAKANPDKACAMTMKRKAAKLRAIPNWLNQADHAEISGQYHFASIMSKITGQQYEVDHEIPLQGRTVCGLHVPTNLQTITKSENCSKHNSFSQEFSRPENPSLNELIQEAARLAG